MSYPRRLGRRKHVPALLLKPDRREAVMDVVWGLAAGEDPLQLSEQFAVHIQDTEKRITEAVMGDKSAAPR